MTDETKLDRALHGLLGIGAGVEAFPVILYCDICQTEPVIRWIDGRGLCWECAEEYIKGRHDNIELIIEDR